MKVLAFAATGSSKSINKQLATYAANQLGHIHQDVEVETIDLIDYELPIFNEDREAALGQPDIAKAFLEKIGNADVLIISFAEYNGSYSSAYKNTFDWASRISRDVFQNKPMLLLATSPGPGGAANVLSQATTSAPYFAGDVKGSISVPAFYDNFDVEQGTLNNADIQKQLNVALQDLVAGYTGQLLKVS